MMAHIERNGYVLAPSSQINCGYSECGFAKLEPADDNLALLECALANTQQVADEDGHPDRVREVKQTMRAQGLPAERMFAAITCGHLAAGSVAICRYRVDNTVPTK